MTTVTLSVDARGVDQGFLPRGDVGPLVNLWRDFEPNLYGYVLSAGQQLTLKPQDSSGHDLGSIVVTVEHPVRTAITSSTPFQIVSVVERPHVARTYRCHSCEREHRVSYGPFMCRKCPKGEARVCDDHVQLLPGSLEGTCPRHAPSCQCGEPATAYCIGPRCRSSTAWCAAHLRQRGDSSYCAQCYEARFPACVEVGCRAVGSLPCQHIDPTGRACRRMTCPRHTTIWQIFGPERAGLARCPAHASVMSQTPAEMVYQILANAALQQRAGVPRIAGFRYILAKPGRINPTEPEAYRLVLQGATAAPALRPQLDKVVQSNRSRWEKEINEGTAALETALTMLRAWMHANGAAMAVPSLVGVKWLPARADKPPTVLVRLNRIYFNFATRQRAEQALGFAIQVIKEDR